MHCASSRGGRLRSAGCARRSWRAARSPLIGSRGFFSTRPNPEGAIMRYRLTILAMLMAPMAHAQFAVIDVASVGQLLQQAATLARQLQQAEAQVQQARSLYQSLTGPRG